MIYHVSFSVINPGHVARVLAEISGATVVAAPTPPFPSGSWFLCFGNDFGNFVEILPSTASFDPDAPFGIRHREKSLDYSPAHVLLSAAKTASEINQIAANEGWRVQEVETGFFKVIKLWIDQVVLVEFLTQEEAQRHQASFNGDSLPSLDHRLREMEKTLKAALADAK